MSDMREKFEAWNRFRVACKQDADLGVAFQAGYIEGKQDALDARADAGTVEKRCHRLTCGLREMKTIPPRDPPMMVCDQPGCERGAYALSTSAPQPHALADEAIWLIWSNEHTGWWNPERIGYTSDINQAGHYTYQQAVDICGSEYPHGSDGVPDEIMVLSPKGRAALRQSRERDLRLINFACEREYQAAKKGVNSTAEVILQAFEERER